MLSTSAKLAVNRRALRAATWLDLCAGHLLDELEKQIVGEGGSDKHSCARATAEHKRRNPREKPCQTHPPYWAFHAATS